MCHCFPPGPWRIQMATESLSEEVTFKLDLYDEKEPAMWRTGGGGRGEWGSRQKEVACETLRWKRARPGAQGTEERKGQSVYSKMSWGERHEMRLKTRLSAQRRALHRLFKESESHLDHHQTGEEVSAWWPLLEIKSENEHLLNTQYIPGIALRVSRHWFI